MFGMLLVVCIASVRNKILILHSQVTLFLQTTDKEPHMIIATFYTNISQVQWQTAISIIGIP